MTETRVLPHTFQNFSPRPLGKVEIDNYQIRAAFRGFDVLDISDGRIAVADDQKFAFNRVVQESLAHQSRICLAILDQQYERGLLRGVPGFRRMGL